jgi:hypothetical protein
MNIEEVKQELGYETLNLNTTTKEGVKTDWMRHWDFNNRVAISVHKDTVAAIKANTPFPLGIQTETRTGSKGSYVSHRIVMYSTPQAPPEVQL